jgi:Fe-S oxidoreductase
LFFQIKYIVCVTVKIRVFKGNKEINIERTEDALETQAEIIATGCPFCNTMMTDGVKNFEKEGAVKVMDVAELIAHAADL